MPKLIIKQNNSAAAQQSSMAMWLSVGGLLVLLAAVAAGAFFFTKTSLPGSELEPLTFSSATNENATNSYQSLHAVLGDLMAEYEGLAGRGVDDYQKNLLLLGKSESILGHLDKMDVAAGQLGLNAGEAGEVTDRHQFYKDFWQAKLHFRELRVSRFVKTDEQAPEEGAQTVEAQQAEVQQQEAPVQEEGGIKSEKPKFQFAKPPEGMEMPAGFCDLSNPENSCKPDNGPASVSDLPALDDLALPEDDLPVLDNLALPEALPLPELDDLPLPDDGLPLPNDSVAAIDHADDAEGKKKPKFQFAKPPAGMEMPAGFCDLSNPENSCKPDTSALAGSDLPALDDLASPEALPALDDLELPLPALDDLSLPLPTLDDPELPLPALDDLALPEPGLDGATDKSQL